MQFLLERRCDVDLRDLQHMTPLHVAAKTGSAEMVRFLINKGVQINIRDNNERTPLAVAEGEAKTVLEDYGAK